MREEQGMREEEIFVWVSFFFFFLPQATCYALSFFLDFT